VSGFPFTYQIAPVIDAAASTDVTVFQRSKPPRALMAKLRSSFIALSDPVALSRCLDSFSGRLDELHYVVGVGDHRYVVCGNLDGGGAHALGELPLSVGRDGLIPFGDQEPGRV
jgi:hypothetical protein